MILVLASAVDSVATGFVGQAGNDTRLLTCRDLSVPGWRLGVPQSDAVAVVGGERIPASRITGVVTRLPFVSEAELPQIAAGDCSYVASEMQAFMHAFLISLRSPVVNRPTAVCLAGPNWRRGQWYKAAREAGLRVSAGDFRLRPWAAAVIGEECLGILDPLVGKAARQLAHAAAAPMLRLWFCGEPEAPLFWGADLWPDISRPEIAGALMNLIAADVPA